MFMQERPKISIESQETENRDQDYHQMSPTNILQAKKRKAEALSDLRRATLSNKLSLPQETNTVSPVGSVKKMVLSHYAGRTKGVENEIELEKPTETQQLPLSLKYADLIAKTRQQVFINAENLLHKQTSSFDISQTKTALKSPLSSEKPLSSQDVAVARETPLLSRIAINEMYGSK